MKNKPNVERCDYSAHTPNGEMVQSDLNVVPIDSNIAGGKVRQIPYLKRLCFGCGEAWFTKVDAVGKKNK